jgi:hypothetical protein
MTQEQHFDVAAYALGVLDDRDATRFEDHLIDCMACAMELESLLPVVDVLADVDADALVATEQSRQNGQLLTRMIGEVKKERKHEHSRRLYTLAAAVVVFAMLSIGALFAGSKWLAPDTNASTTAQAGGGTTQIDPLPPNGGNGGPDLPGGDRYGIRDPRTGVRLDAALEKKDMGTQISFEVSNITGPRVCQLVITKTDGGTQVVSSWTVGEKGWGTAAQPQPLTLQAVTALTRDQIAHLSVQALSAAGTPDTLVQVP